MLQSALGWICLKDNIVSDLKISFSDNLQLELLHLENNTVQLLLCELKPRQDKTVLAVQRVPKEQLEHLFVKPRLVA